MSEFVPLVVEVPPLPHCINALMNTKIHWSHALAELIDNSIDAGALRVEIQSDNRIVRVVDDGHGVPDVKACFQLGNHHRNAHDGIGQYGVGAKDVWTSKAGLMRITTVHRGRKTIAEGDCTRIAQEGFKITISAQDECESPSMTAIELHLRKGINAPTVGAIEHVSWLFTPALRSGKQIVYATKKRKWAKDALKPFTLPPLVDVVESEFEVDGRGVSIRIGILADGCKMHNGPFWLIRGHRIIESTSIGVGRYSARRIAGEIVLHSREWSLAKHKDSLTESYDRLHEAIFCRIEGILRKADEIADTFECNVLRSEIQALLDETTGSVDKKKEKRNKGDSKGTSEPKNTGRERLQASKVSELSGKVSIRGSSFQSKRRGIVFDWVDLDGDNLGVVESTGRRVSLNVNNPYIQSLQKSGNKNEMFLCVAALISDHDCRHEHTGQKLLAFDMKDFSEAMGRIVKEFPSEGDNVKAKAI